MLMTVSGQRKVHLGPVETNNLSSLGGSFKFKKKFPLNLTNCQDINDHHCLVGEASIGQNQIANWI